MNTDTAPTTGEQSTAPAKSKRNKTGRRAPAVSKAMHEFWNDPERVAGWKVKHEAQMAARRADPDKNWSRKGIPNGFNREQAEQ